MPCTWIFVEPESEEVVAVHMGTGGVLGDVRREMLKSLRLPETIKRATSKPLAFMTLI